MPSKPKRVAKPKRAVRKAPRRGGRKAASRKPPTWDATGRTLDWKRELPALRGKPAEVAAWIARELREQEQRYRGIVKQMDALETRRRRWIQEFYRRIQTSGFYLHADIKRRIEPEAIPPLPKKVRVVY
jgi:hypothetical protein